MAFEIIQSLTPNGSGSVTQKQFAYSSPNTAGNLLLLIVSWSNKDTLDISTVVDSAGNTWQQVGTTLTILNVDAPFGVAAFEVPSCLAGNNTVTATLTGTGSATIAGAITEIHSTNSRTLDVSGSDIDDTSDLTVETASISAIKDDSLFVGMIGSVASRTLTADSGWTAIQNGQRAGFLYDLAVATGAHQATGTWSGGTRDASWSAVWSENPSISSVTLDPDTVTAGEESTGTVTLDAAAPAGGAEVSLSSDSASTVVPASVTVLEGETSADFTVTTSSVPSQTVAEITATYNGEVSANLTIEPSVYSVPDCRDFGTFPNDSRNVQNTETYDVPAHPSHPAPVDSRTDGPPVDSRIDAIKPLNSRTFPPFGGE